MKTLTTIVLLTLALSSCKDDPIEQAPPAPDCNCDKYVQVDLYNSIGYSFAPWITINECTGVQKDGTWQSSSNKPMPVIGDCK